MTNGSAECGVHHSHRPPAGDSPASKSFDVRRVYVALAFVPLFYVLVRYVPPIGLFSLVMIVTLLALTEFYRLHFTNRNMADIGLGLALAAIFLIGFDRPALISTQALVLLAVAVPLLSRLFVSGSLRSGLIDSAVLTFGVLYVALPLGHVLLLRELPDGIFLIFFIVLVTWAGDTGAYYVGTLWGRRKLAPVVSPNKTIEGLAGGLIVALIAALVARAWFLPAFTVGDCIATGLLLTLVGVLGDLSESALKRSAGVKDSGLLLPAHGGMLDRLDSLLFTTPTFYYYVTLVKGS